MEGELRFETNMENTKDIQNENNTWYTGWIEGDGFFIPVLRNKFGQTRRMSLESMKSTGAPIPTQEQEYNYKMWCKSIGQKHLPPLHKPM